jgi:hypothetical protein
MGADAAHADARNVLEWLQREGIPAFTVRDVYRGGVAGMDADRARAALRLLQEHGWVRVAPDERRAGRPSEGWLTYPGLAGVA